MLEDRLILVITKGHVLKFDIAAHRNARGRMAGRVVLLPEEGAVFMNQVRRIRRIGVLGRLAHHLMDALRACDRCDNSVVLA